MRAASTQNQAKNALLFLYKRVPGIDLSWRDRRELAQWAIEIAPEVVVMES
jgi:hypothetical protein